LRIYGELIDSALQFLEIMKWHVHCPKTLGQLYPL